jgi:hypothetical protein
VQLTPRSRRCAAFPVVLLKPDFDLAHVTPIKADKLRKKNMSNIDFTLLIDALARLVAALTTFVIALRRHRR